MLLEARALSKRYGEDQILENLSLELDAGQSLVVAGPSGSGKSTLLSILGLLLGPDGGQVFFNGDDTANLDDAGRSRLRNLSFGFLFQHVQLVGSLRAIDNVLVPALLARKKGLGPRAEQLLRGLGLEERLYHYPHQLSIGQKRRVALARALLLEPRVVFADEPTNDLDAGNAAFVADTLFGLQNSGGALVLVTHDDALMERADTLLRLA